MRGHFKGLSVIKFGTLGNLLRISIDLDNFVQVTRTSINHGLHELSGVASDSPRCRGPGVDIPVVRRRRDGGNAWAVLVSYSVCFPCADHRVCDLEVSGRCVRPESRPPGRRRLPSVVHGG